MNKRDSKRQSLNKDVVQLGLFDVEGNVVSPDSPFMERIATARQEEETSPKGEISFDENLRKRGHRQKLKVTFPDGTVVCDTTATETFLNTLRKIGMDKAATVNLEIGHLPIFSQEVYPKYKGWMKPVCDGWFVNLQSDTQQKYLQLKVISNQLQLGLKVEIADDFTESKRSPRAKFKRNVGNLGVTFPNNTIIKESDSQATFINVAKKVGLDNIMRKNIQFGGKPLVTTSKRDNKQLQTDGKWLLIPNTTKDKAKCIISMSAIMRLNLKVSMEK